MGNLVTTSKNMLIYFCSKEAEIFGEEKETKHHDEHRIVHNIKIIAPLSTITEDYKEINITNNNSVDHLCDEKKLK